MTRNQKLAAALAAITVLGAAGLGLFRMGQHAAMDTTPANPAAPVAVGTGPVAKGPLPQSIAEGEEATRRHMKAGIKAGDVDPANGHKVLYYHDPMVPGNKFDKPAKSPFMDMMLVPVYAGADSDQGNVVVSPRIQQNLGVRTAVAAETTLSPQITAVGNIAFNEREQAVIQARATGYVERLLVRATLDRVSKGQALAELYVPDWVAAQQEYLGVRRLQGPEPAPLVEGAKSRMRLAGMSEEQIRGIEASGRVNPRTTVVAPSGGLVTEIAAREGMAVMPGATLFRITGFSTVWANAEVPESQAALLRPGARVTARATATPGVTYGGRVQTLLPDVNAATRTIKARVELANPRGQLVPGMFVSMNFSDTHSEKSIVVPSEAVIYTGKRTVVIVAEENGRFRPVEVQAGIESGGHTEIRKGLQAGQRVVVSSQFLIDSEASLKGVEARLNSEASAPAAPAPAPVTPVKPATAPHKGEGTIRAIGKDAMAIAHGPLPSIGMDAMTMEFKLPPAQQMPRNMAVGDRISFEFTLGPDGPQLTRVSPAPAVAGQGTNK